MCVSWGVGGCGPALLTQSVLCGVCVCVCVGDLKPENVLLKAGKGKGGSAGAPGEGGGVAGDSALRSVTAKVGDFGLW